MADYSAAPLDVLAISYDTVLLTWAVPTGTYTSLRVVRNQIGFAETSEDGVILVEDLYGSVRDVFIDNGSSSINIPVETVPLSTGKFAHYSVWVSKSTGEWIEVARNYCLIPKEHSTKVSTASTSSLVSMHDKVMSYLPRVYTSISQSPLDDIDTTSDLYKFMQAFSFTLDEMMSYADTLGASNDPSTISPSATSAEIAHIAAPSLVWGASRTQKNLIANLPSLYPLKGSKSALDSFTTLLTGYSTTVTDSPNLMLSTQSSSFNGGTDAAGGFDLGGWVNTGGGTFTYSTGVIPQITASSSTTGTVSNITVTSATGDIVTNQTITGTNIAAGTYVVGVSGTAPSFSLALSKATTGNLSGTYTFQAFTDVPSLEGYALQLPGRIAISPGTVENTSSICAPADIFKRGIPVTPGTSYNFTYYVKGTGPFSPTTTAQVEWYDNSGVKIGTAASWSSAYSVTAVWSKASGTAFTAPSFKSLVPTTLSVSGGVATLTFAAAHGFANGEVVYISDSGNVFDGAKTITGVTTYTITFATSYGNISSTDGFYMVVESQYKVAYALLSIKTAGYSSQYIDLVQFAVTGSATDFYEARGVDVYLAPTKINYIKNPSFEVKTGPTISASAASGNGSIITYTSSSHGLVSGQVVSITGFSVSGYNVTKATITYINSNSFSVLSTATGTATGTGTITFTDWSTAIGSGTFTQPTSTHPWQVVNGTKVGQIALSSSGTPIVTATTDAGMGVGQYYTFSIYMQATTTSPPSNVKLVLTATDGTLTATSDTSGITLLQDSWTRHSVTLWVPATFSKTLTYLMATVTTSASISSTTIQMEGAQLEVGIAPTDYFDGSYTAIEAGWTSNRNPNASSSYYYPNKTAKLALLKAEIVKWIPFNTPYMVRTAAGVEFSGVA